MGAPPEIPKLMAFMEANLGSEAKAKLIEQFGRSGITPALLATGVMAIDVKTLLAKNIMEFCFKPTLQSPTKLRMIETQMCSILGIAIYGSG